MGYFSNGTEGEMYMERYCAHCAHFKDCWVWAAHMKWNYAECNNDDSILNFLIPRSEDKLTNEQCTMFIKTSARPIEEDPYIPLKGEVATLP